MRSTQPRLTLLVLLALSAFPPSAHAAPGRGPYAEALAKCLVQSTTDADRTLLVSWMFGTMALHPAVQALASVSDSTRDRLNQDVAAVVQHLLTVSCQPEARAALANEGPESFQLSFGVLGQVAARELFGHPTVAAGVSAFAKYLSAEELTKALQPPESH
jgi:hypothetical protein